MDLSSTSNTGGPTTAGPNMATTTRITPARSADLLFGRRAYAVLEHGKKLKGARVGRGEDRRSLRTKKNDSKREPKQIVCLSVCLSVSLS